MARKATPSRQVAKLAFAFWKTMTQSQQTVVGIIAVVAVGAILIASQIAAPPAPEINKDSEPEKSGGPTPSGSPQLASGKTVVFCHWNMENLFDDRDDVRRPADEDYDNWFANDPEARKRKYQKLAAILVKLNDGIGPDIIVGNEVESYRAADLLRETLNATLPPSAAKYDHVAMKDLDAGRHIGPCVISRYPLSGVKLLGRLQRILKVNVAVNGHDLVVIGSHWTSQLSDKGGDETRGRASYATVIYDVYRDAIRTNPNVDLLVCGDFNDSPDADSVTRFLHMTGDKKFVTPESSPPRLFGPLTGKSPESFGTHYYQKPLIYDQIGMSAGLLDDGGWSYVPDSIRVPTDGLIRSGDRSRRPWRYGSKNDNAVGRGYSDHFPVLATFQVAP